MRKIGNTGWIVIGMLAGIAAGSIFGPVMANLKIFGDIFLRLIQMSVVILVLGGVIEAVGSLRPSQLGNLGAKTFLYFACTTIFSAVIGLMLANIFQPGSGILYQSTLESSIKADTTSVSTIALNFFPTNIFSALSSGNTIQVIIFGLLFGSALSILGEKEGAQEHPVLTMVKKINEILIQVIKMIMKAAPFGIFSLLGWAIGTIGLSVILPLIKFLAIFAVGDVIILSLFITLSALHARVSPLAVAKRLQRTVIVAFTTASSAITLPTQMEDSETRLGISKNVSRLVNPLGMSLNSDGLALYLVLACMTIAQFFNIELTISQQITVVVLSTLQTLGTIVVPGGGLVALAIVLPSVGLPIEGVALLAGIDWFSGMLRTVLNVVDDTLVALSIAKNVDEFDRTIFDNAFIVEKASNANESDLAE